MHESPTPNQPASSLDAKVRRELSTRTTEIRSFITGEMPSELRTRFVEELVLNRPLRLAIGEERAKLTTPIAVSEQAHKLLHETLQGLSQSSGLFPGDRFIAGIENRSDIQPQREKWLMHGIEHADKLIALGELEDIALENRYRAEKNIINARAAAKRFGASSSLSSIEGMLEATASEEWDTVPGRFSPYYLPPPKPDTLSLEILISRIATDKSAVDRLVFRLGELYPERYYISKNELMPECPEPRVERAILEMMRDNPNLRSAIERFVESPVVTSEAGKEALSKAFGARLLLGHAVARGEPAAATSIARRLEVLIDQSRTSPLGEHAHGIAEAYAGYLAIYGDKSSAIWEVCERALLHPIIAGTYGMPSDQSLLRSIDCTLVECLSLAEARLVSDDELQSLVISLARGADIPARYAALSALEKIPKQRALEELAFQVLTGKDERLPNGRGFSDEYNINQRATFGIRRIILKDIEWAKIVSLDGSKIDPTLSRCKTACDVVEQLYHAAMRDPKRREWDSNAMSTLLDTLYELNPVRALPLIRQHLVDGPINHYGHYPFIDLIQKRKLKQLVPDLITHLATREIGSDGHRSVIEALESFGYSKPEIGKLLVAQPLKLEVSHPFMRLVEELKMPVSATILEQACAGGVDYTSIWAIRLARNLPTQQELEPAHVSTAFNLLSSLSKRELGMLDKQYSLSDDALETVKEWLKGPSAAMVAREFDALSAALVPPNGKSREIGEGYRRQVQAIREISDFRKSLESTEPKAPAFLDVQQALKHLLTVVRPPVEVMRHFYISYASKSPEDLSLDQLAARTFIQLCLGDNYYSVHQYFSEVEFSNRKAIAATKHYSMSRDRHAEADIYRYPAERHLREISVIATGLMSTELAQATEVFRILVSEFDKQLHVYERFDESALEPKYFRALVGSLIRLGRLDRATEYMRKHEVGDFGSLFSLVDVARRTAQELVEQQQSSRALELIRFAQSIVPYMPKSERAAVEEDLQASLKGMFQ